MPEASGEPLRPGERLGHYQVRRLIAAGGMAEIYEAFSAALNQRVAIKVLRPGLRQHGEAAARFANEARAINLVRHSGEARRCVPTIHDMGTMKEGASYL